MLGFGALIYQGKRNIARRKLGITCRDLYLWYSTIDFPEDMRRQSTAMISTLMANKETLILDQKVFSFFLFLFSFFFFLSILDHFNTEMNLTKQKTKNQKFTRKLKTLQMDPTPA
jgi:hypothetical protein